MTPLLAFLLALALWLLLAPPRRALTETADEPEDDDLVLQAQAGDRQAFNRLVGRHQRLMYNIAYRTLGNSDRAADATQDAFLSAYRKIHQYTGGSFRAWMARIVRNQCYDLLRYEKRRPAASLDALLLHHRDPTPAMRQEAPMRPDRALLNQEVATWMQEVIMELPPDQRMTLVLSDVHGYAYQEIAEITEVELGTVKSRLFRARRKVQERLLENAELLPEKYRL